MKKHIYIYLLVLCALFGCKDNSGLYGLLTDYDNRIAKLEQLCSEMNTNITSLTTIVEAQQSGETITSITPITENGEVIGYTITFANHDPITIYTGRDGSSGQVPVIGAKQDTDGVYYWTIDGEWLLDEEGNKLRVTGKSGAQGTTPQLKIEGDYWWISYDNGATWTQLGQAKGDKGDTGEDGDSMFQSVTQDENYVYFTLADGTVITIGKGSEENNGKVQIVDGAIMAEFSVSATKKVYFSQGDLLYIPEGTHICADGTIKKGRWRFADKQYEHLSNNYLSYTYRSDNHTYNCTIQDTTVAIDEFMIGSSGFAYPTIPTGGNYRNLFGNTKIYTSDIANTYSDWGQYNPIENGGNQPGVFRTLTYEEWKYLLEERANAELLRKFIKIDGIQHLVIFPDNWPYIDVEIPTATYTGDQRLTMRPEWKIFEDKGVVALLLNDDESAGYWTSTFQECTTGKIGTDNYKRFSFYIIYYSSLLSINGVNIGGGMSYYYIETYINSFAAQLKVRLVKDVE